MSGFKGLSLIRIPGSGGGSASGVTSFGITTNDGIISTLVNPDSNPFLTLGLGDITTTSVTTSGTIGSSINFGAPTIAASSRLTIFGAALSNTPYTGKTITIVGDSITAGTGASSPSLRFSTLLCGYLGATENNQGLASSTLEKRSPINPFGAVNLIDRMSTAIPVFSGTQGLLIIEMGVNDYGYTGVNYNTTNYTADYNTVLNFAITTQGWPASNILILSPGYVSDASFAFYAGLSGLAAPTRQRILDFVSATQAIALSRGTLFINMYEAMLNGGGSNLLTSTDGVHPINVGHAFMAAAITGFLGGSITATPSLIMGNTTSTSTATPAYIDMGGTFSSTVGDQTKCKLILYDSGTPSQTSGLSVTAGHLEYHIFTLGTHDFYINGVKNASIGANSAIGAQSPTARLHLPAGTATANSSPLKINSGVLLTTPEIGAIETDGTHLYWTDNAGTRHTIV